MLKYALSFSSSCIQSMKGSCCSLDLLAKTQTPQTCYRAMAASERQACSCGNSTLFPYRGQECMHVSPYPSGKRWNRPQRSRVTEKERARFPPHPSLFMQGLPLHLNPDLHTTSHILLSLWTAFHNSEGIRERTRRN